MTTTRVRRLIFFFVALCAVALASLWLDGGWNLQASSTSPDGRYRVDLYRGTNWQRATYQVWFEDPGFARLTRTSDGQSLATSKVIELADSPVTWIPAGVLVSTQAEFRYATRKWE